MITTFSFFHYFSYLNIMGILPFFCIFFLKRITIDTKFVAISFLIFVYISYLLIKIPINFNNLNNVSNYLRYYLGVFFFFFVLRDHEINFSVKFLYILISLLLIEFLLINFFFNASLLPNFPDCIRLWPSHNCPYEYKNILGFQRAHGFGARPGITVGIILVISYMTKFSRLKEFLVLMSVFLTMSGIGIIAYLFYIILNLLNKNKINFYIFIFLFLIICFFMIASGKFTIINFTKIMIDKLQSIEYIIQNINLLPNYEIIINQIFNDKYGGDKGIISLFNNFGLLFTISIIVLLRREIFNVEIFFPLLIMIITSLHYASIFSVPGQIVTAYLLSYGYKNKISFKEIKYYQEYKNYISSTIVIFIIVISASFKNLNEKKIDLTLDPEQINEEHLRVK